ncbi:MAG: hypothetical protein COA57_11805 [Flavobacteriales bacterium]|nr:MAG: hypothetical protein COA57_11805 [Flavobacteriales bacterium]
MKKITIIFSILLVATTGFSQQINISNQYLVNPYFNNPAYAGSNGNVVAFAGVRKQWVGIEGAPFGRYISLNGPISDNMGLGGIFTVDQTDIIERFNGRLSYNYGITLAEEHNLTFGIEGQIEQFSLNLANVDVDDVDDQVLLSGSEINGTTFDGSFGLRYNWKGLDIGVAVPQLIESPLTLGMDGNTNITYEHARHYLANVSYQYDLKEDTLSLKPIAMVRYAANSPFHFDVGVLALWQNMLWGGVLYRKGTGIVGILGVDLYDKFSFGYTYEMPMGKIASHTSGSHEVFLGIQFGKNKKKDDKLKKWVEEQQEKTAAILDSLNSKIDNLNDLSNAELEKKDQKINQLENDIDGLSKRLDDLKKKGISSSQVSTESRDVPITQSAATGSETTTPAEEESSKASEPELKVISSGKDNGNETPVTLEKGYYVVVESFRVLNHAKRAQKVLKEKGYTVMVVHNTKKNWYFVYLEQFSNLPVALKEMENIRKSGFSDAWVHIYK